jgi:glycosyltransferase involved in cell wall biosynthesis
MRIAQVMLGKGFGGAERSFVDLSRALAAADHDVLAVGERRGVALQALRDQPRIECCALRCWGNWDHLASHTLARMLRRFQPDLVQTHLARASHLGGRAARRLGLPTLAKTHALVDLRYYRAIDHLVATTQAQATYLRDRGIAPAAISIIPNFSALPAARGPRAAALAAPRVKSYGRWVAKKGFADLLDAFALVVRKHPDARLVIGGSGIEGDRLRAQARALHLERRVEFCGWIDDVAAFLSDADLFVLPSRDEPFGIAVLEAMACAVPIVSTATAGPSEILDEECAFLARPGDVASLAANVDRALADPALRVRCAERALAHYAARYSQAVVVPQYLALYRDLSAA